ncbi:MBG domain-containing protein [Pinibacter soli]|uniref:MBG domain-containing protein n=1 Tax=Pinibacter soli TaxID=3044211 RepID=A0ABT6RF38_9BACT|nr:MBG domain-containing protein [Pinibacter soli]MDI3321188.1 MBG domain-containing protein [Pinibacter soli]
MRPKLYLSILLLLLTGSLFSQTVKLTDCNETSTITLSWTGSEFSGNGVQGTYHLYPVGATWMLMLGNAGDLYYHNLAAGQTIPTSWYSGTTNVWVKDNGCALSSVTVLAGADVTTGSASSVSFTTATVSGNVTYAGNGPVSEKGIAYGTSTDPTIADGKVANGSGTGAISSNLTGLTPGTWYHARAYATNATGTAYGAEITFQTPVPLTVASVTAASPNPTNASSVLYTVTFSDNATNVTPAAFGFTTTGGLTGPTVTGVSGSGTTYTVTVNTGSGDGGLRLVVNGNAMGAVPTNSPYIGAPFYQIDKTAPTTSITANPPALTNSTNASFSFTSSESPSTFVAKLDAGSYAAPTSPQSYSGLSAGSHTFYVMATDNAGNTDATPATYTWTIDNLAPVAPVVVTVANGASVTTATPVYSGTAEISSTVNVIVDGTSIGTATADASGNWTLTQPASLSNGSHTVKATATDAAGNTSANSSTNSFTVSLLTISPTTVPSGTVTTAYSQTLTASNGTTPYAFIITSGSLPAGVTLSAGGVLSGTPTAGGTFNFVVKVTDAAAKTATQSYTLTIAAPSISMAPASVPAANQNVAYIATVTAAGGTAPYSYSLSSGALPPGMSLTNTGTLSGTPTASGTFNLTITAQDGSTGAGPYTASKSYSLVVNALPTLTFSPLPASTYGDADLTLSATSTNPGPAITYTSMNTAFATIVNGNQVHIVAAGTVIIKASQAGDANHGAPVDVQQTLVINPMSINIIATAKTKEYGSPDPVLNYTTLPSPVNGDVISGALARTAGENVGTYSITQGTLLLSSNYTITYYGANFSITAAPLTITADSKTKTYGDANPALTATYTGWVNGDGVSSFTTAPAIATTATTSSPAGNYPINVSGAVNPNYTITYVVGNLAVNKATLTITADNKTKVYGQNNPLLTISYSGFVNNDDATKLTPAATANTSATAASAVGDYTITASGAVNANYTINYVNGKLSITSAALTITADNKTKAYGAALPTFTATYSGWVNGDGVSSLANAPSITTTATAASNAGNYPITATGAVNANYNISYVTGNLAITTVPLTIKADDKTKIYGDADPALTYVATGLVNGDGNSVITGALKRLAGENVGNFPINQNTLSAGNNYIIAYTAANFAITPATLTITANPQTKVYGTADPALTFVATGWKYSDDVTIGKLARVAGENAGTYAIQQGTIGAGANYTIAFFGNTFTITKAPQLITWSQDLTIGCTADIAPIQLNATANSGLAVSYSIANTSVGTISGNSLTPVLPGYAVITANQAGDANHFAAPSVTNTVNYRSASAIRQHWSDVLMFDNSSNNYTKWEWYKNNTVVTNQTSAYYSEAKALNGTYYVVATDKNNVAIQSCPLTLNGSATVTAGIKVYPNPSTAGSSVTVTCSYTAAALQGAKMAIVDMSGKVQQELTNVTATQTIAAPSARGMYYITLLLKNGAKTSVNLLVK